MTLWAPSELREAIDTAPALSLWQPWMHAVLRLDKAIENRVWPTNYRGPVLLHAAKDCGTLTQFREAFEHCHRYGAGLWQGCTTRRDDDVAWWSRGTGFMPRHPARGGWKPMQPMGGYLGIARIIGCVDPSLGAASVGYPQVRADRAYWQEQDLRWRLPGQWAWLLQDVAELPFVPGLGRQRLFNPRGDDRQRLREAWLDRAA